MTDTDKARMLALAKDERNCRRIMAANYPGTDAYMIALGYLNALRAPKGPAR